MVDPVALAIANNDVVHLAWDFKEKIPGCLGFAVYRVDQAGNSMPLWVGHDAQGKPITTEQQPVTKLGWRDVFWDMAGAFRAKNGTYKYRIVAMEANGNSPSPMAHVPHVETKEVTVSEDVGNAKVFFNRGLLATQMVATAITKNGKLSRKVLEDGIAPGGLLRPRLSGEMVQAVTSLAAKAAKDGGSCYAALYELTDSELLKALTTLGNRLHIILANNNGDSSIDDPAKPGKKKAVVLYDSKNRDAHKKLLASGAEVYRRYLPSGRIGHNKFMVFCDASDSACEVMTGSTNWTPTGLCTQSNNTIVLSSSDLASCFKTYWMTLRDDTLAAGETKNAPTQKDTYRGNAKLQGKIFRGLNHTAGQEMKLADGKATVQACFSTNTKILLGKKPEKPYDMELVFDEIRKARQSVLFLTFMPSKAGSTVQHLMRVLAEQACNKKGFFIRGAVSDPDLAREFEETIRKAPGRENAMVVSPAAVEQDVDVNTKHWLQEMFKLGHAVVHDKVVVIDPFGDKPVVVTGSHNLGYRASHNNDENMLIIRGDSAIARAYAAHVMDVFEHYRARWFDIESARRQALAASGGKKVTRDKVLKYYKSVMGQDASPTWQNRYYDDPWRPAYAERLFWRGDGKPLPKP